MTEIQSLGDADIAGMYQARGAQVAKEYPKPVCAVVVEYTIDGHPSLLLFGDSNGLLARERVSLILETIGVLTQAASACNADASS